MFAVRCRKRYFRLICLIPLLSCLVIPLGVFAQEAGDPQATQPGAQAKSEPPASTDPSQPLRVEDVLDLSLEQLSQVPVRPTAPAATTQQSLDLPISSVDRVIPIAPATGGDDMPTIRESAAAVYVVTQEDIRRSGVLTIPDALRMVPGLQVAQIDANKWAITSRGFNGLFANKLLVLIDGRTIYTPQFGGVNWVERDVFLDDVERIEVIRGPGATIWGSNAVNGIINIITKNAKDTQGGLAVASIGTDQRGLGALRYGMQLGENTYFRLHTKYSDWDNNASFLGDEPIDGWNAVRSGFRLDSSPTDEDTIMITGNIYRGNYGTSTFESLLTPPYFRGLQEITPYQGGHLLARWTHTINEDSDLAFQFYYDRVERRGQLITEARDTFDFSAQYHTRIAERHDVTTGIGYRVSADRHRNSFTVSLIPADRTVDQLSAFLQDNIEIVEDRLNLTIGAKVELNDFSGFEYQPSARFAWTPDDRQTIWGSVSRAVRVPDRVTEHAWINTAVFAPDSLFPGSPLSILRVHGDPTVDAEDVIAYELGYRISPNDRFFIDLAGFFNRYDNLLATGIRQSDPIFEPVPAPPHFVIPLDFLNDGNGETYGVEIASTLRLAEFWRLHAGYTWLQMQLHGGNDVTNTDLAIDEGSSPHHQFHLRSFLDLTSKVSLDGGLYYVDNLPALGVPSYVRLDLRLGWQPKDNIEFVLGVQNLTDPDHLEFFAPEGTVPTLSQRSVYGLIRLRF